MSKRISRCWTSQQDQNLLQLVNACPKGKIKWMELSRHLSCLTGKQRTGKQCRQRWQHQLNPQIRHDDWTDAQIQKIFELHQIHGNKWSIIAESLKGRSDNIVKNFFYAFIRKGITKINSIVGGLRTLKEWRQMRPFDSEFTSKLILVNDGNYKDKVRLNSTDLELTAKEIMVEIIALEHFEAREQQELTAFCDLVKKMHGFRLNSKKRKQSKKCQAKQRFSDESEENQGRTGSGNSRGGFNCVLEEAIETGLQFSLNRLQTGELIKKQKGNLQAQIIQEENTETHLRRLPSASESMEKMVVSKVSSSIDHFEHHAETTEIEATAFPIVKLRSHRSYTQLFESLRESEQQELRCVFAAEDEEEWQFMEETPRNFTHAEEALFNSLTPSLWNTPSFSQLFSSQNL